MCKLSARDKPSKIAVEDVAKHCTPEDCWVIVHGKVYDVTQYIPRHPGGAMIYVKAGGDCSQLFDSYHTTPKARYESISGSSRIHQPPWCHGWLAWGSLTWSQPCSAVLEKFRIGDVERVATLARYEQQGDEDKLYEELKHAVSEYFHENKVELRPGHWHCLLSPQHQCDTYMCCSLTQGTQCRCMSRQHSSFRL